MSSWFLTQLIIGGFPSQRDSNLKSVSLVPDSSHHRECQRGGAETIQSGLAVSKSGSHFNTFNTLRPRQNGQHFPNYIFKCIFFNENIWILIKISLKFVPQGPISNILALVQIMAWRQLGDKPFHYLNQWWLDYWHIYASLGLNELTLWDLNKHGCSCRRHFSR